MPVLGDASLWEPLFPERLIPEILSLVVRTWDQLPRPDLSEGEVSLTRRFRARLRQDKDARLLPLRIERESVEDTLEAGEELGRIDLRFSHGFRENVYFAFECKRLNLVDSSRRQSKAGEYVSNGLMRFIDGRYGRGLDSGGMIGYVMDGDVRWAIVAVDRVIRSRREVLRLLGEKLANCPLMLGHEQIRETRHEMEGQILRMFHLFLPM